MKHLGKFALAALLTTVVAFPAYATSGSSGTGSGSAGTAANSGTSGTTSARIGADADVGVNNNTVGSTGTATNSSGTVGARIGADTSASTDSMTMYSESDADRSGTLSLDEYQAYNGTTGTRAQIQDDFRSLDTNRDNYLSQSELNARATSTIR